jgi:branched-chain amino acid transport system substrate-binding protein
MSTRRNRCIYAMFVAAAFTGANAVQAEDKEIVVGLQCDRTGPTQIVGTVLCPGYHDYIVSGCLLPPSPRVCSWA